MAIISLVICCRVVCLLLGMEEIGTMTGGMTGDKWSIGVVLIMGEVGWEIVEEIKGIVEVVNIKITGEISAGEVMTGISEETTTEEETVTEETTNLMIASTVDKWTTKEEDMKHPGEEETDSTNHPCEVVETTKVITRGLVETTTKGTMKGLVETTTKGTTQDLVEATMTEETTKVITGASMRDPTTKLAVDGPGTEEVRAVWTWTGL